ncbi:hypothetical protein [Tsukamurella sp. PLM1]|uniref:hypothetical protein n=1 Tax=Tsukamurella sp. PLM1 TaxID=2929795 RepID=UPI00206E4C8A|nr:hypothetical protein [Tsukamurella sp. PLM1]BDH58973.1 hypothetical protein MTP03_39120 [Tsukamurella sp. PLM1]
MPTSLTVALIAVLSTVGLVGAAVSDGAASLAWAVGTVVAVGALAWRLRSAPAWSPYTAAFATAILVVSAGVPAAIVLTETAGGRGPSVFASEDDGAIDPSAELRRALTKAGELLPGGADAILSIDIDENSTQVYVLDLTKGQRVSANYSQSSDQWYEPNRHSTTDRADATFRATDLAGLDLTAATKKATAAADTIGVDRSSPHASDGVEIERRSPDKKLVATFGMSGTDIETDAAGNVPDNLALAKVDGLLPLAERLLRANGFDPAQPVLDRMDYRVFAPNVSSVGSGKGTVELSIDGAGKRGTLRETVGKFPEVDLRPSTSSSDDSFALRTVSAAAIERARADLVQRRSIIPIDAHALGLRVDRDTRRSSRAAPPVIMEVGLGPDDEAYYSIDGSFLRADD